MSLDETYVELAVLAPAGQAKSYRWELRKVGGEVLEHGAWHTGRATPTKDGSSPGRRAATKVEADSLFADETPAVLDVETSLL